MKQMKMKWQFLEEFSTFYLAPYYQTEHEFPSRSHSMVYPVQM
jgi:hypothetical protein